jgi:mRNA interferase MazF
MVVRRGEIWWASLPDPLGSGPGFRRPLIIVQSDAFNRSRISTVIAVVITSNLRLAVAPGNLLLPYKTTGLPKDSVANLSQLVTVDKSFLTEKVGKLTAKQMQRIEEGLRLVLSL